ncbi:hypothetical protein [Psychrilyobacter atlanticus]|uniref:hypothetical protein n=1 Tax=Psychrilyobacter atlanticus TaxID=271091 RepID=UPI00040A6AFC|nr:hypothetical protein [Psychrilyobacter atlanticus]
MLIVIYALLSCMSIFDSGDVNDEIIKIKKEQNIEIINGDEKSRIINNSFSNQTIDSYGLELYYSYDKTEKRKNYGINSITSPIGYINDTKKNQGVLIDVLDNTFIPTIGIKCKFNPSIEFQGEKN